MKSYELTGSWTTITECGSATTDDFLLMNKSQQTVYIAFGAAATSDDAFSMPPNSVWSRLGVAGAVKMCSGGASAHIVVVGNS